MTQLYRIHDCEYPHRNGLVVKVVGNELSSYKYVQTVEGSDVFIERDLHLERVSQHTAEGEEAL